MTLQKMILTRMSVAMLILLVLSNSLFAQSDKIIRVGYIDVTDMILNPDSIDKKGYGLEIFQTIEHYSDLKFEYVEVQYANVLEKLLNNEIDILGPIGYASDRAKFFSFGEETFVDAEIILVADKDSNAYYNDPKSIQNKTVMVFEGNPYNALLEEYLNEHTISVDYIPSTEYSDYLEESADFYLATSAATGRDFANDFKVVLKLGNIDLRFMALHNKKQILEEIDEALRRLKDTEHGFYDRLYAKYFDYFNAFDFALTREQADLLQNKTFSVGFASNHQPYQYVLPDGSAHGINVQVLNTLAEKHNFKLVYTPIDNTDTNQEHFKNFDIVLSMTGDLAEYNKYYEYTEAYIEQPIVLFTNNNVVEAILNDEKNLNFGMINYNAFDYEKLFRSYPNSTLHTFTNLQSLLDAYQTNKLDGIFLTANGSEYALQRFGSHNHSLFVTSENLPLRFFISKNLPDPALSIFNIISRDISTKKIEEILFVEKTNFVPEISFLDFIRKYSIHTVILIFTLILVILIYKSYSTKEKYEKTFKLINYDKVTGLPGRYLFEEHMRSILKTAKPREYQIISIDIDHFKNINKTYGKEAGDKVLSCIANNIIIALGITKCAKKNIDMRYVSATEGIPNEKAIITRDNADKLLLFINTEIKGDVKFLWRKIIKPSIAKILGANYAVHLSAGKYIIENVYEPCDIIIDHAHKARMLGKNKIHSTFSEYTAEEKKSQEITEDILFKMEKAIKNKEFVVYYQPKVGLDTLQVKGAEALIRWIPPDSTPIYPDSFIPVFEATGFIVELDYYVFEEVCSFISRNRNRVSIPIISVNLSGHSVLHPKTIDKLLRTLDRYKVDPSQIELEVTESALVETSEILIERIQAYKKLGFSVSLDDFGSGASSLNRLAIIDVDTIKMDKAFLDDGFVCNKKFSLVKAVITIAKEINTKLVAEGVETEDQAYALQHLGCDLIQGYYFSRPLDEQTFSELLLSNKVYPTLRGSVALIEPCA